MANKKSFVFYYDWRDIFEPFDNETMGMLLRSVLSYAIDGVEPEFNDIALKISFNFIKSAFDRDKAKYEKICEDRAKYAKLAHKKSVTEDKEETCETNYMHKQAYESLSKHKQAYTTDNDNDNVNDNDNDNVNDNDNTTNFSFSKKTAYVYSDDFLVFWKEYPKKVGKGEAFKQWKKAKIRKNDLDDILCALNWQKRSSQWCSSLGRYIPNPSTYISQRRWEDEPQNESIADISDPLRYTDGDELPEFIMKGEF